MDYRVCEIEDERPKRRIADAVLRDLPDWFGIEEAIVEYVQHSQVMRFWAALVVDDPVGFLALHRHNVYTSEIYCMGVRREFHRHGIGAKMMAACEVACRADGTEFLIVKTLDESRSDDSYARTRQFYNAMGFRPLEVFPRLWGEANPCVLMAKYLTNDPSASVP